MLQRRAFLRAVLSSVAVTLPLSQLQALERQMEEVIATFCMIRQIAAHDGMRSKLVANFHAMQKAVQDVGGVSVFEDAADENAIWVLDFWRSREDYDATLEQAKLSALLAEQRSLIANIQTNAEMKIPTPIEP
jgi:quinol monooxygenase YgiN